MKGDESDEHININELKRKPGKGLILFPSVQCVGLPGDNSFIHSTNISQVPTEGQVVL